MRPGEFKIMAALMSDPNGLTFKSLKEKTKLSNPVLSEYLTTLLKHGIILREAETRHYCLPSAFLPKELLPTKVSQDISALAKRIPIQGIEISFIKEGELRKKVYEGFLNYHLQNISALIIMSMRQAILDVKEIINKANTKLEKERKTERYVQKFANGAEFVMKEYAYALNERITNWIIPYIHMLSLAYFSNRQFTLKGIDKEILAKFSKDAIKDTSWFKALHAYEENLAQKNPVFTRLLRKRQRLEEE